MSTTPYDRNVLVEVLVYHWRTDTAGCGCGWAELGKSHAEHVANVYEACIVEGTDPDTCEFAAYDQEGNVIGECRSIDYEVVEMYDGDTVRICAKHRSWVPALGRIEQVRYPE